MVCLSLFATFRATAAASGDFAASMDPNAAARFAGLALKCLHDEYPSHISVTMDRDSDARPPRELTPAFYGCFDWHSDVHGHWLLVRLLRLLPDAPFAAQARAELKRSFTAENIAGELEFLKHPGRASFERPYGLAWLLRLCAELREWQDPQAAAMAECPKAAGNRGSGPLEGLAAQTSLSDSNRRTRSDRVFIRLDVGLGRDLRR